MTEVPVHTLPCRYGTALVWKGPRSIQVHFQHPCELIYILQRRHSSGRDPMPHASRHDHAHCLVSMLLWLYGILRKTSCSGANNARQPRRKKRQQFKNVDFRAGAHEWSVVHLTQYSLSTVLYSPHPLFFHSAWRVGGEDVCVVSGDLPLTGR